MSPHAEVVGILADDLIWSTRLSEMLAGLDVAPRRMRRLADLEAALDGGLNLVVIDLTALAYDGVAAVELAADAGARVLAVGQHDDLQLRRGALAAGAERVVPYRRLLDNGPATLRAWLAAGHLTVVPE
jgi:DNA-binding NarL/FixJ family response regulator